MNWDWLPKVIEYGADLVGLADDAVGVVKDARSDCKEHVLRWLHDHVLDLYEQVGKVQIEAAGERSKLETRINDLERRAGIS